MKLIHWGFNYHHDDQSIIELACRIPLFLKRYLQFYFRIRPRKIKDWKVPLNCRVIFYTQVRFV